MQHRCTGITTINESKRGISVLASQLDSGTHRIIRLSGRGPQHSRIAYREPNEITIVETNYGSIDHRKVESWLSRDSMRHGCSSRLQSCMR